MAPFGDPAGPGRPGAAFRVLLTMRIHRGREQEFERAWSAGSTVVTGRPGCLGHTLARGAEDPAVYYIESVWTDEASFRAFENSPVHLEHRAHLHPYRSGGTMATMTVVYDLGRAPV